MAISVNWPTKVISVPKNYLTFISGDVYELDVDQFRLDLRSLEDDEQGITFLKTHRHNTEVTLGGVTYARIVEIINGYTVTFEDGQYIVRLAGANNNILAVANYNQVSIREQNSAGLVTVASGSGLSQDQSDKLDSIYDDSEVNTPKISSIDTTVSSDSTKIDEVHERFALNTGRPVTHAEDGIDSSNIDINITDNQDGTYTEQRQ